MLSLIINTSLLIIRTDKANRFNLILAKVGVELMVPNGDIAHSINFESLRADSSTKGEKMVNLVYC